MIRLAVLFLALFALAGGAAWYADHPGTVTIMWGGWRLEASLGLLGVVLFLTLILAVLAARVAGWLLGGPGALRDGLRERQRRRGFEALSKGLVAVAAGDAGEARRLAKRTQALLDDPPLTLLLNAQAAQLEGDDSGARAQFEAMCERPETEFLGLRGLLAHARRAGDEAAALRHAERAFEIRPDTPWVLRELLASRCRAERWDDALATLAAAEKHKAFERQDAHRTRGSILYLQARAAAARGEDRRAEDLAGRALKSLAPFAPAAALVARHRLAAGDERRARKMLLKSWRAQPHPLLAEIILELSAAAGGDGSRAPLDPFTTDDGGSRDNRLLRARAALAAEDGEAASMELKALAEDGADREVCRLMADLCAGAGREADARGWLERGLTAPAPPHWRCRACGHQDGAWQGHCPRCGGFAGYVWHAAPIALPAAGPPAAVIAAEREPKAELILPEHDQKNFTAP